ncbi:MAG: cysteine desulfurase [Deltaproteobacteria bacterium]|nr:cysteine desulfurase [Deltaproteobacteria bacterium]
MIYLDNAATTRCDPEVLRELVGFYEDFHGNPSGLHKLSWKAEQKIAEARSFFANYFKVQESQVIFTSGGTEANNLAISGYLKRTSQKEKRQILTSPLEHASVWEVVEDWKRKGNEVIYLPVDRWGQVDVGACERLLTPHVALVSLMAVNNEIGTLEPIEKIGQLIRQKYPKIAFHVDGVQAFGKIHCSPWMQTVDFLTLSAHKIHGPLGSGALICSGRKKIEPLFWGGGQEFGLRSGTQDTAAMMGFYLAAQKMIQNQSIYAEHVRRLNDYFRQRLSQKAFSFYGVSPQQASPYILSVCFPGVSSEVLLRMLEEHEIYASAGSSCQMKLKKTSRVLLAIGVNEKDRDSVIRFGLSKDTTREEIDRTLEVLENAIQRFFPRHKGPGEEPHKVSFS